MNSPLLFTRSYKELILLPTLRERFEYLKLNGVIGGRTFGGDRYLNQILYKSPEWRSFRNKVIIRDSGCELAMPGYEICPKVEGKALKRRGDYIIIHHINPLTPEDVEKRNPCIFDMDNVVCVSPQVHKAIHYGDASLLPQDYIPRFPNDTCPWKR